MDNSFKLWLCEDVVVAGSLVSGYYLVASGQQLNNDNVVEVVVAGSPPSPLPPGHQVHCHFQLKQLSGYFISLLMSPHTFLY